VVAVALRAPPDEVAAYEPAMLATIVDVLAGDA